MAYTQAQWNSFQASMPPEERISYLEYLKQADPDEYKRLTSPVSRLKADAAETSKTTTVDERTKLAGAKTDTAAQKTATTNKGNTLARLKDDSQEPGTSTTISAVESAAEARAKTAAEMAAAGMTSAGEIPESEGDRLAALAAAQEAEGDAAVAAAEAARIEAARIAGLTAAQRAAEEAAAKAEADRIAKAEADKLIAAAKAKAEADAKAAAEAQARAEAALAAAATAAELAAAKAAAIAANEAKAKADAALAALAAKAEADAKAASDAAIAAAATADANTKAALEAAAIQAKKDLDAAVAEAKRLADEAAAALAAANINVSGNQNIPDTDAEAAAALAAEEKAALEKTLAEQKAIVDKLLADAAAKAAEDAATAAGKTAAEAKAAGEKAAADLKAKQEADAKALADKATADAAAATKAAADKAAADALLTQQQRDAKAAEEKVIAEKAAQDKARADAAAAAKVAMRDSTIKLLTDRFSKYGLDSLTQTIKDLVIDGASEDTITLTLSETDAYKDRFKANEERRKKGLAVLDPGTYLRTEDSYRQVLREYGLKQFDNDDSVSKFIANDVSPAMMSKRIVTAVQRVQNADPAISKQLRDYYGIGQEDLVAYVLDPEQQFEKIERQIAASEIGAAAARQGIQAGVSVAEQLAAQGVSEAEAQKGYATIADVLPTAEKLSDIYGTTMDEYRQSEAEQEQFNSLASAQRKRLNLRAREIAAFSGSSGLSRTSLTTPKTGQF